MSNSANFREDSTFAHRGHGDPSSKWATAFCALALLFFLGAVSHLFGEGGGRVGPMRGLYVPLASLIQLTAIVLLLRPTRVQETLEILRRNGMLVVALAVILMSTVWSIDPAITLRRALALLGTTAVGLLIYIEVGRAGLLRFFVMNLALFVVGSVVLALVMPQLGTHPSGIFAGHWRGLVDDKNGVAPAAAVFLILCLGVRKQTWVMTWSIPLLAVGSLLLYRAGSATGYASLAFGIAVFVIMNLYRKSPPLRLLIVCGVGTLLLIATLNYSTLFNTALAMLDRDATLTGRTAMWQALTPLITERFWLGTGYGAFWYDPSGYSGFSGSSRWMADMNYAHNAYIDMLLNVGAIGLVIQLAFLFIVSGRLLAGASRDDSDATTMLVVVLTLLFVGIVDTGALFRANAGLWVMIVAFACYAAEWRVIGTTGTRRPALQASR